MVVLPILISCASVGKLLRYLFPIPNHLCLGLACGIGLIGLVLTISPNAPQAPAAIVPIGTAAFSMSLCLNFIVSALIVGRIWYITGLNREIKTDSAIRRASAIIIESGLLFLAAQLVFVVLFAIKHPAQAIVEPIATQIYVSDIFCFFEIDVLIILLGHLPNAHHRPSWHGFNVRAYCAS